MAIMAKLERDVGVCADWQEFCADILVVDYAGSNLSTTLEKLLPDYTILSTPSIDNIIDAEEIKTPPKLIIVDVNSEHCSPFHVLMNLRQSAIMQAIPIIVVGEASTLDDKIKSFSLGCDDFIELPMQDIEIVARVEAKIKQQERQQKIRHLAYQDELTGLMNRRGYNEALHNEWARCKRNKKPISMLLIDVDNFKQYNDSYGHKMGDNLLRMTADALTNVSHRSTDALARYGGDEFVFLLPDCDYPGCISIANMIIKEFHRMLNVSMGLNTLPDVSLSIGIASTLPDKNNNTSVLFEKADKALYTAKEQGKDCWQIA